MKVVNAVWEKRNLGVSCSEVEVDRNDSYQVVVQALEQLIEKEYMVIRIPSSRYDLVQYVQEMGYSFIETAFTLIHTLKDISVPGRLLRICNKCKWDVMDDDDLQQLWDEIHKNIFKTDRVYIDGQFSKEQAAQRYEFWIRDLIEEGHLPYKVMFEGDTVGFFLNKEIQAGVYDGLLAATYQLFEGSGMGYCIQYAGLKSVMQRGARRYIGHVSGNNPEVLRVLLSIGFSIKEMAYIFIKHNK